MISIPYPSLRLIRVVGPNFHHKKETCHEKAHKKIGVSYLVIWLNIYGLVALVPALIGLGTVLAVLATAACIFILLDLLVNRPGSF